MKKILLIGFLFIGIIGNSQTLDTTFGTTGIVTNQFTDISSNDICYAAALQPDGKIIYVGRAYTDSYGFITRRNSNGTLDTTFNNYGFRKIGTTGFDTVALQSDGKILIGGFNGIYRLNINGSLDTTFNSIGLFVPIVSTSNFYVKSIIPQANGKILIAGYANTGINNDFAIFRINSNGTLDTTFDTDGKATFAIGNNNDECYGMAVQTDGKIVLVGQTNNGTNYDIATIRLNNDGSIDNSFGNAGKVINQFGASRFGRSINIQADGKILLVGSNVIIRLTTSGALDTTFDGDGIYNILIATSASTSIAGLTLNRALIKYLSSGKILVSATSNTNYALLQLNSNGTLDTSFGTNGVTTTDVSTDYSNILLIRTDGKIISGGTTINTNFGTYQIQNILYSSSGIYESESRYSLDYGKDHASKIIEQSTGKTVVLCESRGGSTLIRYNIDGSIDNTFGSFGFVYLNNVSTNKMININDKILLTDNDIVKLHKFNADGSYDTTFGISGVLDFSLNAPNYVGFIDEIYYNSIDGYTYVGFDYDETLDNPNATNGSYGISRMTNNGSIDSSFGVNGIARFRFDYFGTTTNEWPAEFTKQSNGKLLVSGFLNNATQTNYAIGIFRLNTNGTLDTTFGTNGKVVTQLDSKNLPTKIILNSNDTFYINTLNTVNNFTNTSIIKYLANGSLDTSFGTNGVVNEPEYLREIVLQTDGKIIKGGSKNSHFITSRYNTNGTLDTTYGTSGYLSTPINNYSGIKSLIMLNNGKLLAGGYTYDGLREIMAQARYTNTTLGTLNFESSKNDLIVYPNPIQDEATFEYTLKNDETISIDIVDMQGKIVQSVIGNQKQLSGDYKQKINLSSDLSKGNYFLRFSSQTGQQAVQIIKK